MCVYCLNLHSRSQHDSGVNLVWKVGVVGPGLKTGEGRGSYKLNKRRWVVQNLGYHHLIYTNLTISEKSPLWKVFSPRISVHYRIWYFLETPRFPRHPYQNWRFATPNSPVLTPMSFIASQSPSLSLTYLGDDDDDDDDDDDFLPESRFIGFYATWWWDKWGGFRLPSSQTICPRIYIQFLNSNMCNNK